MKFVSRPQSAAEAFPMETGEFSPRTGSTLKSGATYRAMVCVFLSGVASATMIMWLIADTNREIEHGYAKKAGIMHTDPTGREYWDDVINGARGTSGLRRN